MPGKKLSDMTDEEQQQMREKMAAMRQKALEKKLQMGEVTSQEKDVQRKLKQKELEDRKAKVELMKHQLQPTPQETINYDTNQSSTPQKVIVDNQQPNKQIDVEALRKQIKAEVKAKYKEKYKSPSYSYFPYYPYANMPFPPQQPPLQPQAPPQQEPVQKQAVKELIKDKINKDLYDSVYKSIFPNL